MSAFYRQTASGLVVRDFASDETAVSASLKAIDDRLILWPPDGDCAYYRVLCRVSDWQPPIPVVAWMDGNSNPLPLSSGLVDEVQKWRPENRDKRGPDADEHNRIRVEQVHKLQEDNSAAITGDYRAKLERSQTTVSVGGGPQRPSYMRNRRFKKA